MSESEVGFVRERSAGAEEERICGVSVGRLRFVVLVEADVAGSVALAGGVEEVHGWIGVSRAILSSVSAATIPPILCPIKTTRTEGSTVGEGVWAETSRSMTLFWSLQ